jgi:hypothetical protein
VPFYLYILYILIALPLLWAISVLLTGDWNIFLYLLIGLLGAVLVLLTPRYWNILVALLWLGILVWTAPEARTARESHRTTKPTEVPIVIRLDLTPKAMRACAEAFARYGFWDVRDYECQVEKGSEGVVVALYGPGADGKAGEKKRLGEVPLGKGR